ncbi:VOC family protein [Saccharibacillus sp. CPCC 101409]|uniref:VOC family protein n=1 Tax=Saccharibacillus sp. CPCC 101409 TaxID=3058041 RepID=UPI002671F04D|nr:VOC family protein [Saccharibacillus sp. CPCC 101409]MDO3412540.1 VOC family protein [Saccharibacillus sp. CPCC 101409]
MTTQWLPYLVMDGNAEEAIDFYANALQGKVFAKMTFGEIPDGPDGPFPEEVGSLISYALVVSGKCELILADRYPGSPYRTGNNVTVCVSTDDIDHARSVFAALSEGGAVVMPLTPTFFSPAFGQLTDRFGVTFQISTTPPEA